MNENQLYLALQSLFGVGLLLVGWIFLWRRFVIDRTRQRLFHLRDLWFNLALNRQGGLHFESDGYRAVRSHLEASIHYIPEASFFAPMLERVWKRSARGHVAVTRMDWWESHADNEDQRPHFAKFRDEFGYILTSHFALISPAFWVFVPVFALVQMGKILRAALLSSSRPE